MAYSSIKPKMGICVDCSDSKVKRLVAGRCEYHYKSHRAKIRLQSQKEDNQDKDLTGWFRARVMEMTGECSECGLPTNKYIFKYAICAVAHILPKSKFPSVADHPMNWMELGASCGCHSHSEIFSNAAEMKVWPEMVRRFKILYPFIAPEERKHIPELLMREIKSPDVETTEAVYNPMKKV